MCVHVRLWKQRSLHVVLVYLQTQAQSYPLNINAARNPKGKQTSLVNNLNDGAYYVNIILTSVFITITYFIY